MRTHLSNLRCWRWTAPAKVSKIVSVLSEHRYEISRVLLTIPSRVPRTFASGQTTGNMDGGKGTSGPENAPAQSVCISLRSSWKTELTIQGTESHKPSVAINRAPRETQDSRDSSTAGPGHHDAEVVGSNRS